VVVDMSKHMRTILEMDPDRGIASVQPGVIRDELSHLAEREFGLTFAPDTSTHAYATLGGMIGTNACGVHSITAGRTSDNVEELEVLTYDGLRLRVGATSEAEAEAIASAGGPRGEIYSRLRDLRDRYGDTIRERYPDIPRRVSGYNLDELLPENGFQVARSLTGSEGTLATVLEATVRLVPSPPARSLLVLGYPDVFHAADHVEEIMGFGPTGLEGIDETLVRDMRAKTMRTRDIALLPEGSGWLLVEFGAGSARESRARAEECMKRLGGRGAGPSMRLFEDPDEARRVWKVREDGAAATAHVPGERDRWPGFEDSSVPPDRMGEYLREFKGLLDQHGRDAALYGHFGDGCLHARIDFDLRTPDGISGWRRFLDEATDLVVAFGGSLSGEHGDGQQRAELLPKMFGDELVQAFRELKAMWDPRNRMNPHKVVDPYPIASNLKLGSGYDPPEPDTHFSYRSDGGSFARATLRCVGVGKCRDTTSGTMCPSYMATLDEQHSTRGRARILYEMLEGDTIADGFGSEAVDQALDLCLSCKGCKGDCPVDVDMATYKAEFLSKHFKGRLRPRAAYAMGLVMLHARVAARVPRIANGVARAPMLGALVKRVGGISPKRELPKFARQTFRAWFSERGPVNPAADPVVLLPDTFGDHFQPEPLKAGTEVLEAAGYRVVVPREALCCGRPLYDYGMLTMAKALWRRMLTKLGAQIHAGTPVVGLEPSCVAAFRDELVGLMPHDEDAKRLSLQTLTLAEFLEQHAGDWEPPKLARKAILHGHCHQEAVMGMGAEQSLLESMGVDFELLDSGCCGMAGSFGFEEEHHDISVRIGELRLLPAVRGLDDDTLIVADGFSCKSQIEQLTDRRALHTAQVIKMALDQRG
jgi:FAD/FMN-containing dehydrogenase/Fe-S oxidoreductase